MKPLVRKPDWPLRLHAYIAQRRRIAFAWGVQDCCQFARGAAKAITDRDIAKGRGLKLCRYRKTGTAARVLARLGGVAAIPGLCGLREIKPAFAQRGDFVLSLTEGRETLCVCIGTELAAPGAAGLVFRPMSEALRAWRIG